MSSMMNAPAAVFRFLLRPAALLLCALPLSAPAWSGQQHLQITRAAGRNVPDEMADFRAFSFPMAYPAVFPDLWRSGDPTEAPRHYFEPDRLPPDFDFAALSPDVSVAFSSQIRVAPDLIGTAPWTICDLLSRMSAAMATNDWLQAARLGAAMAHYVGDLHQPLHCTRNYNGADTNQKGVHQRIEMDLCKAFFDSSLFDLAPAVYLDDPFHAVVDWMRQAAAIAPRWLRADLAATRLAGGHTDTEDYYLELWDLIQTELLSQLSAAATDLSSLYYTAWVDAGRPPVPAPLDELPVFSIWAPSVGIDPEENAARLRQAARAKGDRYDKIIVAFLAAMALLVFVSAVARQFSARRSRRQHNRRP